MNNKEIAERIAKIVSKAMQMNDLQQMYVLGIVTGMTTAPNVAEMPKAEKA